MRTFKRANVVKITDNESKIQKYLDQGFEEVTEEKEPKKDEVKQQEEAKEEKEPKKDEKKALKKDDKKKGE